MFNSLADSKYTSGDPATHHKLECQWTVLRSREHHLCGWGDDQGADENRQSTHCCPLQWHSDLQWNVLCHCNHHWKMQDRGSGGCVPGGQGSTSAETRSCAHCGELKEKKQSLWKKFMDVTPFTCRMTIRSFSKQFWCSWNPLSLMLTFSRTVATPSCYLQ